MFGWEFPPYNSGGLGVACFGLASALFSQNVEIIFILPKPLDVKSEKFKIRFAQDKNFKMTFEKADYLLKPYTNSRGYKADRIEIKKGIYGQDLFSEIMRYGINARTLAKKYDFDIIHAHDWMSFKAGMEAKKVSGKPLVVHIHSTEIERTGGNNINQEIFRIEKEGMEEADIVIAVSKLTKDILVNSYGIPAEKIHVVHNGIDIYNYPPIDADDTTIIKLKQSGNKIVLFVGRITLQKGPDYFLKAAKKVLGFNRNVFFVIAGSGDMEHYIIREAASLGISDRVLFAGFLRGEELNRIYRTADLFVMPSVSEPFGITALESVVNGTPVLVSKQSGVKEALTHVLTCDFWDIEEMANKILAVLHYNSLKMTLKENSIEQVKNVNWTTAAKKCIDIYYSVLNQYFLRP